MKKRLGLAHKKDFYTWLSMERLRRRAQYIVELSLFSIGKRCGFL